MQASNRIPSPACRNGPILLLTCPPMKALTFAEPYRLSLETVPDPQIESPGDVIVRLELGAVCELGNGASIFTRDGHAAREFRQRFPAGMIGVNVGVPAPMAWLPFTGWNGSFFGDLHIQGLEGVQFYTRQKVTLTRWFRSPDDDAADPVWRSS